MTSQMATIEQKNWYRVLSEQGALDRVVQLVAQSVMIQPSNYPKIHKATLRIVQDYLNQLGACQ